eukprot:Opistho-1_new@98191
MRTIITMSTIRRTTMQHICLPSLVARETFSTFWINCWRRDDVLSTCWSRSSISWSWASSSSPILSEMSLTRPSVLLICSSSWSCCWMICCCCCFWSSINAWFCRRDSSAALAYLSAFFPALLPPASPSSSPLCCVFTRVPECDMWSRISLSVRRALFTKPFLSSISDRVRSNFSGSVSEILMTSSRSSRSNSTVFSTVRSSRATQSSSSFFAADVFSFSSSCHRSYSSFGLLIDFCTSSRTSKNGSSMIANGERLLLPRAPAVVAGDGASRTRLGPRGPATPSAARAENEVASVENGLLHKSPPMYSALI